MGVTQHPVPDDSGWTRAQWERRQRRSHLLRRQAVSTENEET